LLPQLSAAEETFPACGPISTAYHTHNATVSDFLHTHPGEYSHFVLLDHQDWLAWHQPQALAEEWRLILANSRPGSRILLRSAGNDLGFCRTGPGGHCASFPNRPNPCTSRIGSALTAACILRRWHEPI
jgi:hypothetical protein